jgi:hypothetical protein
MKLLGFIQNVSAMTEKTITNDKGESRSFASINVTVGDGNDTGIFELYDDQARTFAASVAQGYIKTGDFVSVEFNLSVVNGKKGTENEGKQYQHLRAIRIVQLFKA